MNIHHAHFPVAGRSGLLVLIFLTLLGVSQATLAENLRLRSPEGKYLNAEYTAGDVRRPAVIVLHGFLQTYDFLTTQTIINNIARLDYTVIGPNLSLGTSDRRQSMQCEAPHDHRFQEDLREIAFWADWLRARGHRRVIIVGHSWGSQHAIGFAEAYPQVPLVAIIAISLVHAEQSADVRTKQITHAEAQLRRNDKSLKPYALSFCTKFMASPRSYLSYARWDDRRVLGSLKRLQERRLPVYVVLGSKDRRFDEEWVGTLKRRVKHISVVEGANHFFSSIHEFDLIDRLESLMTEISQGQAR